MSTKRKYKGETKNFGTEKYKNWTENSLVDFNSIFKQIHETLARLKPVHLKKRKNREREWTKLGILVRHHQTD